MRGQKGGFWDRLLFRIRQLKLKIKRKKEKDIIKQEKKSKQEQLYKKQKQEVIIYQTTKRKKYKGVSNENEIKISFKIKNQKKINKIENKQLNVISKEYKSIIPKAILATPAFVLNIPKKSFSINKEDSKQNTNIKNNFKEIKKTEKNSNVITTNKINKKKKYVGIGNEIISESKIKENNQLFKEIKKLIDGDKEKISFLVEAVNKLEDNINHSKNVDELNKIQEQLLKIKKEIEKVLKNYEILKYGDNLKGLNVPKITEIIDELKNSDSISEIINKYNIYLDYYNELSNLRLNEQNLEYKTEYKKEEVTKKKVILKRANIKMEDLNKIEKRLSRELIKQKNILDEFNNLISKIEPEKIIKVQSNYINNLLHKIGGIFTAFLSIPFLKKPKNVPTFAFGLYMLNSSIKSMRGIVNKKTTINYIPSNDYAKAIIANRCDLNYIDYMIDDSLFQIHCLKEEYQLNFSSFYNNEQFSKQLEKITSIESKLLKQSKEIKNIRNKYEEVLNKNNNKILKIKELSNQ